MQHLSMKRITVVGTVAAALVIGTTIPAFATTTTAAPAPTPTTCLPAGHADAWPAWTNGRPAQDPGVRVWHDSTGWHVRVTHSAMHDRVFSGEIATTGKLIGVHAVRLEKNDSLTVGADGHTLRFRFNNYGGVDGFDFATHCAPFLEFGFTSDAHLVPTGHISIGASSRHPARDPFVIARTPATPAV